jgi:hypothetical protein
MRIHVSDRAAVGDLLEFLRRRPDCVASQVSPDEVEANLLGSHRLEFARMELDLRLQLWRAHRPDVVVTLMDGPTDASPALAS